MRVSYKVKDSVIVVRNRPKTLSIGEEELNKDEAKKDQADAFLGVTDTFCVAPKGKIFVWFPWNEGRDPIPEMFYACNKVINWWTHYQKIKNIQIFCDGGTHRSVTVFGAFLMTYFTKEEREKIVAERIILDKYDKKDKDWTRWAQPLDYIESYLEKFPQDRLLFKAMKQDQLGRLDGHSRGIYDIVRERYADKELQK